MSRFLHHIEVGLWAQLSVLVFFIFFVALLLWVFHPGRRGEYEKGGRLPLEN